MANLFTSDRRLYLSADGKVVEEGDPSKATLLVAVGGTIPIDQARELGLLDEPEPEEKAKAPPTNKARKPSENK